MILVLFRRLNVPTCHGDVPNADVKAKKVEHMESTLGAESNDSGRGGAEGNAGDVTKRPIITVKEDVVQTTTRDVPI